MTPTDQLTAKLKNYFGFDTFKGDQEAIIRNLMEGNDAFVLMPTGGGKSLCYQLPSLLMDGTAVVVSPLIALMKNQVDVINGMSEEPGTAHYLNSSLTRTAIHEVMDNVRSGRTKLLYVAPESLAKEENVKFLKTIKISFYAIDEAHCISEWGHDFRPEYRNIRPTINRIGLAPIIALTATATDKVRTDIKKSLGIPNACEFKSSFNRPNLYYEVRPKTKEVDNQIVRFIKQRPRKSGIVYCLSRKKVEELAKVLQVNDIRAAAYHAGLESDVRSQTQDDFLMERIDVIVATIAFGMGIDKPDVRFVIHYDIPKSLEGYYQETGRAGRDGGEGNCITFYSFKDIRKLEKFMEGKSPSEQEIGRQLLLDTVAYAESSVCRRKMLLHYFGESFPVDNCGNCDNCRHPRERQEAQRELTILLRAIVTLKEKYRQSYVVDFVRGRATDELVANKHQHLPGFGDGESLELKLWTPLIRQAQIEGYISRDIDNYGILKLTDKGREYLNHPQSFPIVADAEFNNDDYDDSIGGEAVLSPELLTMLKTLRHDIAQKKKIPPYVIFQDNSLEQMATIYPITETELCNIQGVGQGKARRFGREFLELIKIYCEENEIDRPTDIRVKNIANKALKKLKIISMIDRRMPLNDLAKAIGIDFPTLLDELEAIVYSGTRLNIDYYISTLLDDDQIDEIWDYFLDSDSDSLEDAMEELEDYDYTEEEVRLVRIKFMSEMAN